MGGGLTKAATGALCAALWWAAPAHGAATIVGEPRAGVPEPETGAGNPAIATRSGAAGHLAAFTAPAERGGYEVYTRILDPGGRPVTPPVRVTSFGPRGDRRYNVDSIALVHDDRRDRFLLAYTGLREFAEHGVSVRYARLLDRKGRPAGPAFRLSEDARATYELTDEDAAYDPVTRTFAVTWTPESKRAAVQVRIVDAAGSLIGAFALSKPNDRAGAPAVAANRASGGFVVAWGEGARLFTARVDPRRGAAGPFAVALRPPPPAYRAPSSGAIEDPAMAFDSDRREFGVAWSSGDDDRVSAILFQRLGGDGRRALGAPLGASEPPRPDRYRTGPAVAFAGGDETFTVLWEDFDPSASASLCSAQVIQARRVRSGGKLAGRGPETLSHYDDPSAPIDAGGSECPSSPNSPAVTAGAFGRGFAALWSRWPYVLTTTR